MLAAGLLAILLAQVGEPLEQTPGIACHPGAQSYVGICAHWSTPWPTSPNWNWQRGTPTPLFQWDATPAVDYYLLRYSVDNGYSWRDAGPVQCQPGADRCYAALQKWLDVPASGMKVRLYVCACNADGCGACTCDGCGGMSVECVFCWPLLLYDLDEGAPG